MRTMALDSLSGFNRTFMELKVYGVEIRQAYSYSFNRTFMELKVNKDDYKHQMQAQFQSHLYGIERRQLQDARENWKMRFNRTFMELKV